MLSDRRRFVAENLYLVNQMRGLLSRLPGDVYRAGGHEYFGSGVGKHVRHVLEFYERLLESKDGIVDYDARRRDRRVETEPEYAAERASGVIDSLERLDEAGSPAAVRVRVETHGEDQSPAEITSSLDRELAYLSSHTVHHFAIVATILRIQGIEPPPDFGVAPATIRYEQRVAADGETFALRNRG
jgi:uncharacterized damage-inducible protein DinB